MWKDYEWRVWCVGVGPRRRFSLKHGNDCSSVWLAIQRCSSESSIWTGLNIGFFLALKMSLSRVENVPALIPCKPGAVPSLYMCLLIVYQSFFIMCLLYLPIFRQSLAL